MQALREVWTAAAVGSGLQLLRALRRHWPLPPGPGLFTAACRAHPPMLLSALQELASWPGVEVDWAAAVASAHVVLWTLPEVRAWLEAQAAQAVEAAAAAVEGG